MVLPAFVNRTEELLRGICCDPVLAARDPTLAALRLINHVRLGRDVGPCCAPHSGRRTPLSSCQ